MWVIHRRPDRGGVSRSGSKDPRNRSEDQERERRRRGNRDWPIETRSGFVLHLLTQIFLQSQVMHHPASAYEDSLGYIYTRRPSKDEYP